MNDMNRKGHSSIVTTQMKVTIAILLSNFLCLHLSLSNIVQKYPKENIKSKKKTTEKRKEKRCFFFFFFKLCYCI